MSTWCELENNPIQREIAAMVKLCPPDSLVNVTLNCQKQITGFYVGDYEAAHRQGCQRVRRACLVPVPHAVPIVVTSNSGYPLDQNLYQTAKGISAAARIVEPGGTIFVASECSDGIPSHGNFAELMKLGAGPQDILDHIFALEHPILDQWEAQVMAMCMQKAEIRLFSTIDPETVKACKLTPIDDLSSALAEQIRAAGSAATVAVLPDGPLTVPYVSRAAAGDS